jgi:hypothetical protein
MCLSVNLQRVTTDHGLRRFADLAGAFSYLNRVLISMEFKDIQSSELNVKFDEEEDTLCINHPNTECFDFPLIEIKKATLNEMSFADASQFIGERLILLIPQLKALYEDEYKKF